MTSPISANVDLYSGFVLQMLGIPDRFLTQGSSKKLLDTLQLMPDQIAARIASLLQKDSER